ncbi:MAG: DUF4810 domain-containing protein [Marinifilaceae bacterium]
MIKKIIAFLFILSLYSCSTPGLYSWENYQQASYQQTKDSNKESQKILIENYIKIINHQKGTRKTVPPGIYADYGFLLLQNNKEKEGKEMLEKEMKLYPESRVFITKILKMMKK